MTQIDEEAMARMMTEGQWCDRLDEAIDAARRLAFKEAAEMARAEAQAIQHSSNPEVFCTAPERLAAAYEAKSRE